MSFIENFENIDSARHKALDFIGMLDCAYTFYWPINKDEVLIKFDQIVFNVRQCLVNINSLN